MEEKVMEEEKVVPATETTANEGEVKADKDAKKLVRKPAKRKVCLFCDEKIAYVDYKDINRLRKFVTEKGKILPSRQTNLCAKHQRQVSSAVKRARFMALLPYLAD